MKTILKKFASSLGYEVRQHTYPLACDRDRFDANLATVADATMLTRDRLASLYDQVAYCQRFGIPGCFVECGVWKGGAVGLMALATLQQPGPSRTLHLFDSFQDICAPESLDGARAIAETGDLQSADLPLAPVAGHYDAVGGHGTRAACRQLIVDRVCYPEEYVRFHEGWFQDTLPVDAGALGPIAVLRLDGDWYASTKVCLDNLYDQVTPGGFVIVDDYGTYEGCRLAVDQFLQSRGTTPFLSRVDASCYYLVKPPGR